MYYALARNDVSIMMEALSSGVMTLKMQIWTHRCVFLRITGRYEPGLKVLMQSIPRVNDSEVGLEVIHGMGISEAWERDSSEALHELR